MARRAIVLAFAAILTLVLGGVATPAQPGRASVQTVKKACKLVTKRVHGKKVKVKVCKKPAPKPTPTTTANPAQQAKSLARAITDATSRDARVTAIEKALHTIGVPVYTGGGQKVVSGTNRLYLYDFSVEALAAAMGRNDSASLQDVIDDLTRLGVIRSDDGLTTAVLDQVLQAVESQLVSQPTAAGALPLLLVRQLGLTRGVDLSKGVDPDTLTLDPLQRLLIEGDILAPVLSSATSTSDVRSVRPMVGGSCPPPPTPDPNAKPQIGDQMIGRAIGKLIEEQAPKVSQALGRASGVADIAAEIEDMVLGESLAYSLKIEAVSGNHSTHYGPAGHSDSAGQPISFQMHVTMLDDYGEDVINCLAWAGVKMPKQGDVPGVGVRWDIKANGDLTRHGTFTPAAGSLGGIVGVETTTDNGGIATLAFQPKDEKAPNLGMEVTDHGSVSAVLEWGTAFGGLSSKIAQYLTPKYETIGWDVSRHAPAGFKFDNMKFTMQYASPDGTGFATNDITISGFVCGEDPYARPWQTTQRYTYDYHPPDGQHYSDSGTDTVNWPVSPGGNTGSFGGTGGGQPGSSGGNAYIQFNPGPPATFTFTWPGNPVIQVPASPITVPVQDDHADCPPPDPSNPGY